MDFKYGKEADPTEVTAYLLSIQSSRAADCAWKRLLGKIPELNPSRFLGVQTKRKSASATQLVRHRSGYRNTGLLDSKVEAE